MDAEYGRKHRAKSCASALVALGRCKHGHLAREETKITVVPSVTVPIFWERLVHPAVQLAHVGIRTTHSLGCGMSTTPEGSDDSYVLVAPAAAPSRPPNKAQLRTIKRQVAARRKQGEEVYTDEECRKAGYIATAAPAAAAPAPAAAPPVKPAAAATRTKSPGRTKSPAAVRRGGGRLAPKAELKRIKQAVAARRRAGEEVYTDDEVERLGWHLDVLKLPDGPGRWL